MKVLKFGGTSVGSSEAINNVIKIIKSNLKNKQQVAVICSAFHNITNSLNDAGQLASNGNTKYLNIVKSIEELHLKMIYALIDVHHHSSIIIEIKLLLNALDEVLTGVYALRELSLRTNDLILSFGERLSCAIITRVLQQHKMDAQLVDARDLIKTNSNFGNAEVHFSLTNENIQKYFANSTKVTVVTGFIASNRQQITTTLGRGGSDYTAAIIGGALMAEIIEIWTDVDGVMTTDPKIVKEAFTIAHLSYAEAMEMSHFGAKIIYSPTLQPAFLNKVPIVVKNTFNYKHPGTLISEKPQGASQVKGISAINKVAMINLQGSSMVGVPGILGRLFHALANKKINVILVTQASSEHSICVIISDHDAKLAETTVNQEFTHEIRDGKIDKTTIINDLSVVSIIGDGLVHAPGVSGKIFSALGRNGINIVAIAQGSSELNISTVVKNNQLSKSIKVIHEAFFQDQAKTINLFLVGVGLIGRTLLKQIHETYSSLIDEQHLKINIIGISNSKKMLIHQDGINLSCFATDLTNSKDDANISRFVNQMQQLNLQNTVFVDCTSSKQIMSEYERILSSSISIVTPNKLANSGTYPDYLKLHKLAEKSRVKFLYETNVGAGLPVINTLQNLKLSGDKILKVEGILSGTLSYIFNNFTGNKLFSSVVSEAKAKGYTEPDPRDDLNGTDVARKILILAREAGSKIELGDVKVENILPETCQKAKTVDDFFKTLKENDHIFAEKRNKAEAQKKALRFIAKYENGHASVNLVAVDSSHPFYSLSGSDNIISFTTERYKERPLVVQGSGAGAEVTAAGVFAEIIAISNYLKG